MELYAPWNCIQQVEWRWTRKYNSSTYDKANSVQLSVKRQSRPSVLWIQESSKPKRECLVSPDRACCIRGQLRFIHSWHRTMDYPWFLTADKAIFSGSFILASFSLNLSLLENRAIKLLPEWHKDGNLAAVAAEAFNKLWRGLPVSKAYLKRSGPQMVSDQRTIRIFA